MTLPDLNLISLLDHSVRLCQLLQPKFYLMISIVFVKQSQLVSKQYSKGGYHWVRLPRFVISKFFYSKLSHMVILLELVICL